MQPLEFALLATLTSTYVCCVSLRLCSQAAAAALKPDVVFVLGDVFDEVSPNPCSCGDATLFV